MIKLVLLFNFFLHVYIASSGKYYNEPKRLRLAKDYKSFLEEYHEFKEKDSRYRNATFVESCQKNYLRMKSEIEAHHASYKLGMMAYDRKLQRWSDLSKKEKFKRKCGTRLPRRARSATNAAYLRILKNWPKIPNDTQVNHCHFPNPIQDQKSCGCCWAFSCAQVLEHQLFVRKNRKVQLSVQQLVDCDASNDACDGGWPTNGFRYIQIFGLSSWKDYAYEDMKQDLCKRAQYRKLINSQLIVRQMEVELKADEEAMKKIVSRVGACVVAVHADEAFLTITKGFYENNSCPKNDPNHAMVVCGFGTDPVHGDYWLIRNSWGSSWGEYGYVKMKMGNTCGVASFIMWPVIIGERSLNPLTGEMEERLYENAKSEEHLKY